MKKYLFILLVAITFVAPVSDFSTGTYFLTISSANQTKTEKIIINKID